METVLRINFFLLSPKVAVTITIVCHYMDCENKAYIINEPFRLSDTSLAFWYIMLSKEWFMYSFIVVQNQYAQV